MKNINYDPFNIVTENEAACVFTNFRKNNPIFYNSDYKTWMIFNYEDVKYLANNYNEASSRYSTLYKKDNIDIYIYPRKDPPEFKKTRKESASLYNYIFNKDLKFFIKEIVDFNSILNIDINLIDFIDNLCSKIFLKILDLDQNLYLEFKNLSYKFLENQSMDYKNKIYTEIEKFFMDNNAKYNNFFNLSVMVGGFATLTGSVLSLIRDYIENKKLLNINNPHKFIQESLRMSSIYSYITRTAYNDLRISDTLIPKGSAMTLLIGSANRDEKRFGQDANTFNPDREHDKINLCFGSGIHRCLGMWINLYIMEEIIKNIINYNIHINNLSYSTSLSRVGYQFEVFNVKFTK